MPIRHLKPLLLAAPLLPMLMLAACGGGSESTAPSAPSNFAVGYDVKGYAFSWDARAGATHYELLEDPDGPAGPRPEAPVAGTLDSTSYTHSLAPQLLHERVNATYRLRACDTSGCGAFTAAITPDLTQTIGYFKASTNSTGAFGSAVALSGDGTTLAVGAIRERSNATGINGDQTNSTMDDSGAVYVFSRGSAGAAWSQQAYIKASNNRIFNRKGYLSYGPQFGFSLALSANGDTLAVGAIYESSNARGVNGDQTNTETPGAGAVYVFTRNNGAWGQQAYIKASNTLAKAKYYTPEGSEGAYQDVLNPALFGATLALSANGDLLAVGAQGEASKSTGVNGNQDDQSVPNAGAVYTYTRSGSSWAHQAYVKASNTDAGDGFGASLALSGNGSTLTVSAPGEASRATGIQGDQQDNTLPSSGAVYAYTQNAGAWSQQAYIKAGVADANEAFGGRQALSGDGSTLAVGGNTVHVFARTNGLWSVQARLNGAGNSNGYANSIAMSAAGNILAISTAGDGSNARGFNGNPANSAAPVSGAVTLFERVNGTWQSRAYIKASNTDAHDQFGSSVALSADGSTMAVGAAHEQSKATGVQGDQSDNSGPTYLPGWGYGANYGAVYLY